MHQTAVRRVLVLAAALAAVLPIAGVATAHEEREVAAAGEGTFPTYRDTGPSVVVCKPESAAALATLPAPLRARNLELLERCDFEHIQEAVNWIADNGEPGYRIMVLPGVYREEPSREARQVRAGAPLDQPGNGERCQELAESGKVALSYEEHVACPHLQNLIAVLGDGTPADDSSVCNTNLCDLQIEGTGARPEDVVIDGKLRGFLNGVRADRADGIYVRNLTAQHFDFNGVYIIETAASTIDDAVGRYNHEYGFLTFQAYTLYENCEGYANGDSALYPGASPNNNDGKGLIPLHRDEMIWTTEMRACRAHHNALGISGTTGNSVWGHHNEIDHNGTAIDSDSLFPGHPGTPQNHALFEDNLIHEDNTNYYDMTAHQGVCSKPLWERDYEDGAVCPAIPLPVGTGYIMPGGNFNWLHRNRVYDEWRTAAFQFWIPAEVREEEPDPDAHFRDGCGPDGDQTCPYEETSHWNTYSHNRLADHPLGFVQPNGVDFTWDGEGEGNCWDQDGDGANTSAAGDVTYQIIESPDAPDIAPSFPDCTDPRDDTEYSLSTIATEASCAAYHPADEPDPPGCDFFRTPAVPEGRQPETPTLERYAGGDRIDTAILASREGYPTRARTVVLGRADEYPDALAGAPLAKARGGPLLLTGGGGLDARVAREIDRLGATTVILLGGEDALSSGVVDGLRGIGFDPGDIVRIGGADRFETAVNIARALPATDAFVAKGIDADGAGWVDALAASSVAALLERPILLTAPGELSAATGGYLEEGQIEAVDIVGGEVAVSGDVEEELAETLDEAERVAGEDRFATSLALARFALKAGADPTELWLTTGANWPDGIAAGSAIAVDEGVLMLVANTVADTPVATWLDDQHPYHDDERDDSVADVLERVRILGGTDAVPEAIETAMSETYGAEPGDAKGDRSTGNDTLLGTFRALPDVPAGYEDVTGFAVMEQRLDGTTRTRLFVEGLPTAGGTVHPAHVHSEPCSTPVADNPHYMRDPDGEAAEPNEIHPAFATGPAATGTGDSTVFHVPTDASLSVMIHTPQDEGGAPVLCADLR